MLHHLGRRPAPVKIAPATRSTTANSQLEIATQILAGLALLAAIQFGLLASLLAGLLVHELVHRLAPSHTSTLIHRRTGKIIVVALLAILVIAAIGAAILGLIAL